MFWQECTRWPLWYPCPLCLAGRPTPTSPYSRSVSVIGHWRHPTPSSWSAVALEDLSVSWLCAISWYFTAPESRIKIPNITRRQNPRKRTLRPKKCAWPVFYWWSSSLSSLAGALTASVCCYLSTPRGSHPVGFTCLRSLWVTQTAEWIRSSTVSWTDLSEMDSNSCIVAGWIYKWRSRRPSAATRRSPPAPEFRETQPMIPDSQRMSWWTDRKKLSSIFLSPDIIMFSSYGIYMRDDIL